MTTLIKLCLVLTIALGLTSASPRPTWSRNKETGEKCRENGANCGQDNNCCSNRCQLKCQVGPGGKCERKCADCKHRNDVCRTNGDCCSQACAPDRFDPSKYTCTDEEAWDRHAEEPEEVTPLPYGEGETVSLASRSAGLAQKPKYKKATCVANGHRCTKGGDDCCGFREGVKCHYDDPLGHIGYCKTPFCAGLFESCNEHQSYCCQGLTCELGSCQDLSERSGPKSSKAGEMPEPKIVKDGEDVAMYRSALKGQAEESPYMEEDEAMTGAPSAKETLGKLLKAVFKRLSSGKGIKMTVDVKNPEAVIDSIAE